MQNLQKYPRTPHFSWSLSVSDDDKIIKDLAFFEGEIMATVKMDGENSSLYRDYFHARSLDGNSHESQSWIKNLHAQIKNDIPDRFRICGENLFARHSIEYNNLESYFYIFSIWNDKNECLSWDETEEWSQLLEIPLVPVIYRGHWRDKPEKIHEEIWKNKFDETQNEGYVIRNSGQFHYSQFSQNVGKYVRANHVTSSSHWKFEKIIQNQLKTDDDKY
jgi:hypothetical protein